MKKINQISIFIGILVAWFFLFGIRLIGYFEAISERGIRQTECGTNGCNGIVLFLNVTWTVSFFILIPLVVPIFIAAYFLLRKKTSGE